MENLKKKEVTCGFWTREQNPKTQVVEVLDRLDLYSHVSPFHRCMSCNSIIEKVGKKDLSEGLDPKIKKYSKEFYRCTSCKKYYWKGPYYEKVNKMVKSFQHSPLS